MSTPINYDQIREYQDTPEIPGEWTIQDADDELKPIADFIKQRTQHNEYISPERIKFLYGSKAVKSGGRYVTGVLKKRDDFEKSINDDFDFIIVVYYKLWKELDIENKTIQLDKIISGIDPEKNTKKTPDVSEFTGNMRFFGADTVLNSSEVVDMTVTRIVEEEKETKKNDKKALNYG